MAAATAAADITKDFAGCAVGPGRGGGVGEKRGDNSEAIASGAFGLGTALSFRGDTDRRVVSRSFLLGGGEAERRPDLEGDRDRAKARGSGSDARCREEE